MPSLSRISSIFLCLFVCQYLLPDVIEAQPVGDFVHSVKKFKQDYITDKPFQYSPDDPWQRGNVFRMQTGHSGLFRNCDNEELKRFSPYICWKVHHEPDFPGLRGARAFFSLDLCEVKQRIRDGAGCCAGNCGKPGCKRCSRKKASDQCTTCGIKGCTGCGANQVAVPAEACDQCQNGSCESRTCGTGQACKTGQAYGTARSRNSAALLPGRVGGRCNCSDSQCEQGCSSADCGSENCSRDHCKLCFGNQRRAPCNCGCVDTSFDENSPAGLLSYQAPTSVQPLSNTVQPTTAQPITVQPNIAEPIAKQPCSCLACRLKLTRENLVRWNEAQKAKDEQPTRSAKAPGGFRLNRITADSLSR